MSRKRTIAVLIAIVISAAFVLNLSTSLTPRHIESKIIMANYQLIAGWLPVAMDASGVYGEVPSTGHVMYSWDVLNSSRAVVASGTSFNVANNGFILTDTAGGSSTGYTVQALSNAPTGVNFEVRANPVDNTSYGFTFDVAPPINHVQVTIGGPPVAVPCTNNGAGPNNTSNAGGHGYLHVVDSTGSSTNVGAVPDNDPLYSNGFRASADGKLKYTAVTGQTQTIGGSTEPIIYVQALTGATVGTGYAVEQSANGSLVFGLFDIVPAPTPPAPTNLTATLVP